MKSFKRFAYKISTFNKNEKNPPTVDDNSEEYTDGIFPFNSSHFTNNFQDPDGDSFKLTRITSLPPVGVLKYDSQPIEEGFIFNLGNAGNLTYELPNNYMITESGYCVFDDPINTIISDQQSEGYELTFMGEGILKFIKEVSTTIPNDTDIYAFFDATSMKIQDAEAAQEALNSWYNSYYANNENFTGNLYILPVVKENWLDFPNAILRGSLAQVGNNSDRPNDDFMSFAKIPTNFDIDSNDDNPDWTSPSNVLTLAFIDEVDTGSSIPPSSTAYHRNRNGYGFDQQPSPQYLTDYKNFVDNYSRFDFFKGIFYPIADIDYGNYNNTYNAAVLQGFGAIEGGATYTLQEIEDLGVTFANERRFHWHLDPTHPYYSGTDPDVANPYSADANTPVPNSNYELQGLKNFGWVGIYDKDQPASEVFTSSSFASELNSYLEGSSTSETLYRQIEGNCYSAGDICFDFKTSDDSEFILFSNEATFCLTGANDPNNTTTATPPTVDDYSTIYNQGQYIFTTTEFTNNFSDPDGDSYELIKLSSQMKSSKNFQIGGLLLSGGALSLPQVINSSNIGNLTYQLPNKFSIFNDRLVGYSDQLDTLVTNLEGQGYALMSNDGSLEFYKIDTTDPESPTVQTQTIEGNDIGDKSIHLDFKISDDSQYNLYSNTASIYFDMENDNTAPTVEGSSGIVNSNNFSFQLTDFNTNYTDAEGDAIKSISVISDIGGLGELTYNTAIIEPPFAFNAADVGNLKYTVPNRFVFVGGEIFSFDENYNDILQSYSDQGYSLTSNQGGILTFTKTTSEIEIGYEYGNLVTTKEYCMSYRVSDDNAVPLFSNIALYCLTVPEEELEIIFNMPPTVGDLTIDLDPRVNYVLTVSDFITETTPSYSDPEGDQHERLMISQLPTEGQLELNGVSVTLGQIIDFADVADANLIYIPSISNTSSYEDTFKFKVSDTGSERWSNSGIVTINVATSKAAPTVDDNSGVLSSKIFTFQESSFINNFNDLDGDSYNNVKITSLPNALKLVLLGNDVQVGTTFKAVNSSGLKFILNDRYAVYSGVLYDFGSSQDALIQNYDDLGYKLTDNTDGVLTFTNEEDNTDVVKAQGIVLDNSTLCFNFATSDDSEFGLYSEDAEFCLTPQGDINVKDIYINLPPTIGDNRISTKYNEAKLLPKKTFVEDTHPSYSDPEGDEPWYLKVLSLPTDGVLELDGVAVTVNQEIAFTDIINEKFYYIPDSTRTDIPNVEFDFTIKDTGSNTYANG